MHKSLFVLLFLVTGCSQITPNNSNIQTVSVDEIETLACENIANDLERELCTLTAIGQLLEHNHLQEKHCDVISNKQNKADCYSYFSENTGNLYVCFKIDDLQLRDQCLGETRRIFQPETKIKSLNLCETFEENDKWMWANQCRLSYVLKNEVQDISTCNKITYPLGFYNCVKNIAFLNNDASLCSKVKEREPFPKNYPTLVFSENGCKYWVENKKSYKGLELQ